MLNELISEIFLGAYAVTAKGIVWGKELALAFSARGHRRNFVYVHEDFEGPSAITRTIIAWHEVISRATLSVAVAG